MQLKITKYLKMSYEPNSDNYQALDISAEKFNELTHDLSKLILERLAHLEAEILEFQEKLELLQNNKKFIEQQISFYYSRCETMKNEKKNLEKSLRKLKEFNI